MTTTHEPDLHEDVAIARELERLERRPPLYRFFRGTMYGLYLLAAAWLLIAIAVSTWHSVWGDAGDKLRQRSAANQPIHAVTIPATPIPAATIPAPVPEAAAPEPKE